MIILGVDPGFGTTGYGVIESVKPARASSPRLIEAGILTSKQKKPLSERLNEIYDHFWGLLDEFSPEEVAVEDIFSLHVNPKSSILIGHVRGTILLAAAKREIPVFSYYPLQIKKALLGSAKATKSQTQRMVQTTLGLSEPPRPDDIADALAVALCHANRTGCLTS